jgi:transposase
MGRHGKYFYESERGKEIATEYSKLLQDGSHISITDYATSIGVPRTLVRECLIAHGVINIKTQKGGRSPGDRKKIANMYISGKYSFYELKKMFSVSETTIVNYLLEFYGDKWRTIRAENVASGKKKYKTLFTRGRRANKIEKILQMIGDGYSIQDVAKKVGIDIPAVRNSLIRVYGFDVVKSMKIYDMECKFCGKHFMASSRYDRFCSDICKNEYSHKKLYYGLTKSGYDYLYKKQNGRCAICGNGVDGRLTVDHNHETGAIRGLLCPTCNSAIGLLKDNIEYLHSAIKYLST